jgi:hypothetical protein
MATFQTCSLGRKIRPQKRNYSEFSMRKTGNEVQVLRQLAQDYRSVVGHLKDRGWLEEQQEPDEGLVTSTELAPPQSDAGYIAINFDLRTATRRDANNTVMVQLVTKTPDDDRIKIFKAADVARLGRQKALESFSATVADYADQLEK